jgi:hypothetical protein
MEIPMEIPKAMGLGIMRDSKMDLRIQMETRSERH